VNVLALLVNVPDNFPISEEQNLWRRMFDYIKEKKIEHGVGGYSEYISNANYGSQVMIAVPVNNAEAEEFKTSSYLSGNLSYLSGNSSWNAHDKFEYVEIVGLPIAATVKYSGNIREGYNATMTKLTDWMQANGYRFFSGDFTDGIRCYRLETPLSEENPEDYLTEMQVAVEKA